MNRWLWKWVVLGLVAAAQLLAIATMFHIGNVYGHRYPARLDRLHDLCNGIFVYKPLMHAAISLNWISKARSQGVKVPLVALWSRFQGCALAVFILSYTTYLIFSLP